MGILNEQESREMQDEVDKNAAGKELLPDWLSVDDKGKKIVNSTALGKEIKNNNPMIRTSSLLAGAYFNGSYWIKIGGSSELQTRVAQLVNRRLDAYGMYVKAKSNEIQEWLKSEIFINGDVFEHTVPWLIPFKNGTYNLQTDQLQKPNKNDYILGGFNYNLDTSGREPKTIKALIEYMVGDGAQFLIEYIGYMFYRSYEPFNKFVILQGEAGNGKSTLNNRIIKPLLTEKNISHLSMEKLTKTDGTDAFNTADLFGKYANVFMDLKKIYIDSPDQLKNLTGGDAINARFKGGNEFTLENFATLLFAANDLPTLRDDKGVFSRALVLPTIAPVVRDDPLEQAKRSKLFPDDVIENELPAFAYYALREFKKALDRGELSITQTMKNTTHEWRYSDPLSVFLEEETQEWHGAGRGGIRVNRLYDELKDWFEDGGMNPPTKQRLNEVLKNRGIERARAYYGPDDENYQAWRYIGLDILPDDEKSIQVKKS